MLACKNVHSLAREREHACMRNHLLCEQTIQRALRSALPRCTKLVIAHRLDSIIDADLIWLLENGRLVEQAFQSPGVPIFG